MALWKARSLSAEQTVQMVGKECGERTPYSDGSGSFLGIEDAKMSQVFSSVVHLPINLLMESFEGSSNEQRVMHMVGCVDYSSTPWESVKDDMCQRQVHYAFDKNLSHYGGSVTSILQKTCLLNSRGWIIEEVMTLEGIPLGDYFEARKDFSPLDHHHR